MKRLPILVAVLAGALGAQAAQALELKVVYLGVSDATPGPPAFLVGRKIKISCEYYYDAGQAQAPAWQIQLQVDGQVIGTYAAAAAEPALKANVFRVAGFITPATAGVHQAKCVLDPGGKLKGLDSKQADNVRTESFSVDTGVVASSKQAQPGALAANPAGAFVPRGSDTVAQGTAPVILDPVVKLALKAQPLTNCGVGQDVVAITGTVSNVGQGLAVIGPGLPLLRIDSSAGVYGAKIPAPTGNLAPGQAVPVSANLKPKGHPAALAGATLKLDVYAVGIQQSSATWAHQALFVTYPANFCKTPTPTTGGVLRQAPAK